MSPMSDRESPEGIGALIAALRVSEALLHQYDQIERKSYRPLITALADALEAAEEHTDDH